MRCLFRIARTMSERHGASRRCRSSRQNRRLAPCRSQTNRTLILRTILTLLPCAALIAATIVPRTTRADDSVQILDDFEDLQNSVGGYRNGFAKSPSTSVCRRVRHGDSPGHCFRIRAERSEAGFCGVWIHLHNFRDAHPEFVDASRWKYLTFRFRIDAPLTGVNVRLADEIWIRKEDAVTIGPLSRWTQDGDSKNWREVIIPLAEVEKIDLKRLGALSFEFQSPGNFTLWIDDLCLKQTAEATTPEPSALATPEVRKSGSPEVAKPRDVGLDD
jgi:hypothetical protein